MSAEFRNLHHNTSAKSCAEVRRVSRDVSEVAIGHEVVSLTLHASLQPSHTCEEGREHRLDIATRGHADDASVILLVRPDQKCLGGIAVHTTAIWPVLVNTTRYKHCAARLLEQHTVRTERILLGSGHALRETFNRGRS